MHIVASTRLPGWVPSVIIGVGLKEMMMSSSVASVAGRCVPALQGGVWFNHVLMQT